MSQIKPTYHPDYFTLSASEPISVLSSAVLNGGLTNVRSLLNLRVDLDTPPPYPPAAQTIQQAADSIGLSGPVCGMMTAASMKSLSHHQLMHDDLQVQCWVTAGLSNLLRAGDPVIPPPIAGTINIALWVSKPLTPASMAEALILLTEAKVTAIRDAQLISPVSQLPASGTGTDSHAVLCPQHGNAAIEYCGKHTLCGELIGRAVYDACKRSIDLCLLAASKP